MKLEQPGVTQFTELSDVPGSYVGQANQHVAVDGTATGLDFVAPGGGGGTWGSITGTLSAQTDLQNALDAKVNDGGGSANWLPYYAVAANTIEGDQNLQWDGNKLSIMDTSEGGSISFGAAITLTHSTGVLTVAGGDLAVPDEAYGAGWNGSLEVPTKNAIYDKIETLSGGSPGGSNTQLQYNNAGAFAGITGATTDGTSVTMGDTFTLGKYIYHTGDTNTHIQFEDAGDIINFTTGGTSALRIVNGASDAVIVQDNYNLDVSSSIRYKDGVAARIDFGTHLLTFNINGNARIYMDNTGLQLNPVGSGNATGDTYYRAASTYTSRLPIGSNGDVLTVASGIPAWVAPSAGGGLSFAQAYSLTTLSI